MNLLLTEAEYNCPGNSWADRAARNPEGEALTVEGVAWKQACRDHGFFGAIGKVKQAYRVRCSW